MSANRCYLQCVLERLRRLLWYPAWKDTRTDIPFPVAPARDAWLASRKSMHQYERRLGKIVESEWFQRERRSLNIASLGR